MVKSTKTGRSIVKSNSTRKFYEIFEVGAMRPKKLGAANLTQAKEKSKKLLDTPGRKGRKVVIRELKEVYFEK